MRGRFPAPPAALASPGRFPRVDDGASANPFSLAPSSPSPSSSAASANAANWASSPPSFLTKAFNRSFSRSSRSARRTARSSWSVCSLTAWSVKSFSSVHFSMLDASASLRWRMYWTACLRISPLFFSDPGTIFFSSVMPSLIVSLRRLSTSFCSRRTASHQNYVFG